MTRANILSQISLEITDTNNEINTNIADNVSGAITPLSVRNTLTDFTDGVKNNLDELTNSAFIIDTDTSDAITEGVINLFATPANLDAWLATKNTDELAEGTNNLYFTDARADARINTLRPSQTAVAQPTGGVTVDAEARNAINNIIAALNAANIFA